MRWIADEREFLGILSNAKQYIKIDDHPKDIGRCFKDVSFRFADYPIDVYAVPRLIHDGARASDRSALHAKRVTRLPRW